MPATISKQCKKCGKFYSLNKNITKSRKFCTLSCFYAFSNKRVVKKCATCKKQVSKTSFEIKRAKKRNYKNFFCNSSCAAIFNNKNKKYGFRRSKLEKFVYEKIKKEYPEIKLDKPNSIINGFEIDLYFPKYHFGIEINGILHRKPIYGLEKLNKIKARDKNKKLMCLQNKIKLFVVNDTLPKFNQERATEFFNKKIKPILNKISKKVSSSKP